jgi:hypothetical protein
LKGGIALLIGLMLINDGRSGAGESWQGLERLSQVTVETGLDTQIPGLSADELTRHVEAMLADAASRPLIDVASSNRLRLRVSVRPISATTLRGFYLPFSGTYGIGSVRLSVARAAAVAGVPRSIPAVVWEEERLVAAPWWQTQPAVMRAVNEIVSVFLASYQAAEGAR